METRSLAIPKVEHTVIEKLDIWRDHYGRVLARNTMEGIVTHGYDRTFAPNAACDAMMWAVLTIVMWLTDATPEVHAVLVIGRACTGDLADRVFTELVNQSDHKDRLTTSYAYDCDEAQAPDDLEPVMPQQPHDEAPPAFDPSTT